MKLWPLLFVMLCFNVAQSQEIEETQYETALGVKISSGKALSFKKFISPKSALEAETMFFNGGVRFIALYELHFYNIEGLNGLAWYAGPGAHVGYWKPAYKKEYGSWIDIGLDGVVGLDYKFPTLPVNVSLDWQPSFGLIGTSGIQPQFGGLALRYTFN